MARGRAITSRYDASGRRVLDVSSGRVSLPPNSDTGGGGVAVGNPNSKVIYDVAAGITVVPQGDFDGQDGTARVGTDPDQHEEYFTWNAPLHRWIGKEMVTMSTDDAWALDLSRQPIAAFQNTWARFNGGVGWYRNGPRAFLRSATTLPSATINISTNEEPDANLLAPAGQVLIRNQLVSYTGYVTTVGARQLTGCTGGSGTFPANITPVIPYGAASGGDYGGWGTTVNPIDRVVDLWNIGARLKERARAWLNGSQDNYAMTVAPYYLNQNLSDDFNYPGLSSPPAGGLGFGVSLTGPALPLSGGAGVRIDERAFNQYSTGWTAFAAGAPAKRILIPILYGKMPAAAQDAGEVYGYTLTHRWEIQL